MGLASQPFWMPLPLLYSVNLSERLINHNCLTPINQSDCVVEINFNISKNKYKVIRGIKPNKFEIYQNGTLLDQDASAADQQKNFEQTILKMNYKSFTQIVVLGSSTFVPFMRLPLAARREIIEDILDIQNLLNNECQSERKNQSH